MKWNDYAVPALPLLSEVHAADDDWDEYEAVNDPASGKQLPNEGHAADDDWDSYEAVNDPASGKQLPNEGHAADDDWDSYEAVNDPASGKQLPNEGHASSDDVEDSEWVSDPASGRRLPNVGYGTSSERLRAEPSAAWLDSPIMVTESCVNDIHRIYGSFTHADSEYPTIGITIEGAPIFVQCVRLPDSAVVRASVTDRIIGDSAEANAVWQGKLVEFDGRCRRSSIHIHPMDLGTLSGVDIRNYETLRTHPDDPSTLGRNQPYPVILVNLKRARRLELLGFWVMDGQAHNTQVKTIKDDAAVVREAWAKARKMPFFSAEGRLARRINEIVGKGWNVELGVNSETNAKALRARRDDGKRVLLRFSPRDSFGLGLGADAAGGRGLEEYVDWTRFLNDLVDRHSAENRECGQKEIKGDPSIEGADSTDVGVTCPKEEAVAICQEGL